MADWEVSQPLDYSATGDDIDSASLKIIATFTDVYEKLNRLRTMDADGNHTVGDASPYSFKIDTSINPPALLMRNAANTAYVQVGKLAENMGITAEDVGGIQGNGMGTLSLGAEANLPAAATTYDMYFAYDTGRLYIYRTGAWRVFLSLRFEDLLGVTDVVIERDEVAENGANKIPRLNSVGQGEFDITGSPGKLAGINMYVPSISNGQVLAYNAERDRWEVANRDEITNADVSTTGEANKIVKADADGLIHLNTTGNAAKVALKTVDTNNLQDGDALVYHSDSGTFRNKQVATVNGDGVVTANVSGSAAKWAGKSIEVVSIRDGQILVWSEALQAFVNRNQGAIGAAAALALQQDGVLLANYNGDEYRQVNIVTPHLRLNSYTYTEGKTCFDKLLPYGLYLECVTDGVTAATAPDYTNVSAGDTVADGSVEWIVREIPNTATMAATYQEIVPMSATAPQETVAIWDEVL